MESPKEADWDSTLGAYVQGVKRRLVRGGPDSRLYLSLLDTFVPRARSTPSAGHVSRPTPSPPPSASLPPPSPTHGRTRDLPHARSIRQPMAHVITAAIAPITPADKGRSSSSGSALARCGFHLIGTRRPCKVGVLLGLSRAGAEALCQKLIQLRLHFEILLSSDIMLGLGIADRSNEILH
jgi:hypothetical protein